MNVTAAHLSNEGYKSKKHVRMDGPASLESTNLYAPLLFECVLYKQKCMTSKGGKKKSIERNGKRQRKESDEMNVNGLSSKSSLIGTIIFFIGDESGSNR
jgi:hypothetical protein